MHPAASSGGWMDESYFKVVKDPCEINSHQHATSTSPPLSSSSSFTAADPATAAPVPVPATATAAPVPVPATVTAGAGAGAGRRCHRCRAEMPSLPGGDAIVAGRRCHRCRTLTVLGRVGDATHTVTLHRSINSKVRNQLGCLLI